MSPLPSDAQGFLIGERLDGLLTEQQRTNDLLEQMLTRLGIGGFRAGQRDDSQGSSDGRGGRRSRSGGGGGGGSPDRGEVRRRAGAGPRPSPRPSNGAGQGQPDGAGESGDGSEGGRRTGSPGGSRERDDRGRFSRNDADTLLVSGANRMASAATAFGDIAGRVSDKVAESDAAVGAAKELANMAAPVAKLLFGSKEDRAAKKAERQAGERQRRSEKWWKRIWDRLATNGNPASDDGGSGTGGLLSFILPMLTGLLSLITAPFKWLGSITGLTQLLGPIGSIAAKWVPKLFFNPVTAAIAVAFAGWNVGKWLNEKLGLSEKIGDSVDFLKEKSAKVVEKTTEMVQTVSDKLGDVADWWKDKRDQVSMKIGDGVDSVKATVATASAAVKSTPAKAQAAYKAMSAPEFKGSRANAMKVALGYRGGQITGMDEAQSRAYAALVAMRESGGREEVMFDPKGNKKGFFGKYQLGAEALAESGNVDWDKMRAAKKAAKKAGIAWESDRGQGAFLRDSTVWKTPGGLNEFLSSSNESAQDVAFAKYTNKQAGYLKGHGVSAANAGEMGGNLQAAHLVGPSQAANLILNGVDKKDGNKTKASDYRATGAQTPVFADQIRGVMAPQMPAAMVAMPSMAASMKPMSQAAIKPIQEPTPPMRSAQNAAKPAAPPLQINQGLADRGIAHVVTGGLGMASYSSR